MNLWLLGSSTMRTPHMVFLRSNCMMASRGAIKLWRFEEAQEWGNCTILLIIFCLYIKHTKNKIFKFGTMYYVFRFKSFGMLIVEFLGYWTIDHVSFGRPGISFLNALLIVCPKLHSKTTACRGLSVCGCVGKFDFKFFRPFIVRLPSIFLGTSLGLGCLY